MPGKVRESTRLSFGDCGDRRVFEAGRRHLKDAIRCASLLVGWLLGTVQADSIQEDIAVLAGKFPAAAKRAAWQRLSNQPPHTLPSILEAFPEDDVLAANWLRTAFECIAERHRDALPLESLRRMAEDVTRPGRSRRLALLAWELGQPGTRAQFLKNRLSDPEFQWDAVEMRLRLAEEQKDPMIKLGLLRETFAAAISYEQVREIAQRLKDAGDSPDALRHLGIVRRWAVVGPFSVEPENGWASSFPPERTVDLKASYPARQGNISWKACEVTSGDGRTDLRRHGIDFKNGAVAYAVSYLETPRDCEAVMLVSAVDSVQVRINGKLVLNPSMSLVRRNFRIDAHRVKVRLSAGKTELLVKLVKARDSGERQAAAARMGEKVRPDHPADRWEFMVRLVDARGAGMDFAPAFPETWADLKKE
jgi:hypothetical protein